MATTWVGVRAGRRHRLPRRAHQLRPRERALVRRVRQALHERAGDHRRGLQGHRGSRRPLLRLGPREEASTTPRAGRTRGWRRTARPAARAGLQPEGRAVRARRRTAAALQHGEPPRRTRHSQHPRCVFQLLKRHFARYTPEFVAETCGCSVEEFLESARRSARTRAASGRARSSTRSAGRSTPSASSSSAPPRSSSSCSATWAGRAAGSWRCAATRRSRARPTSRRSTTSCPATCRCRTSRTYDGFDELHRGEHRRRRGWWGHFDAYSVSLMKAYFGEHATAGERLAVRASCRASTTTTRSTGRSSRCSTAR